MYRVVHLMNKDRAKIVLALRAVRRLDSSSDEPWTMKELFAPREDSDARDATLAKYATQKTWQRNFVYRLIEEEVVEKVKQDGHHVAYQKVAVGNDSMDILEHILLEGDEDSPGQSIKWFVFPASYDPPEWYVSDEEAATEDEEENEEEVWDPAHKVEVPDVPSETDEVAITSLSLLTEVSEHLVEIRKSHRNLSDRLRALEESHDQTLKLLPDAIGDSVQAVHDHSFEKLEKGVLANMDAMGVVISSLVDECRKLTASVSIAERVEHLKSQLDVWNNVVQSLHAQGKNLTAGLETVLDVVGEMEEHATVSSR